MLDIPKILILAIVQGAAELLPVSSSAHVIVAEKLMGLDPTKPEMTLLLVMLHTGTMLAVIVFFWNSWKENFFKTQQIFWDTVKVLAAATIATGIVGLVLKKLIEKIFLKGAAHAEIEMLFGNMLLISAALASVGALILCTGFKKDNPIKEKSVVGLMEACLIGLVQGLCLPFRGFSRSGATISTGLILGIRKKTVEDFSFALAVIITPPVILMEALRFLKAQHAAVHHGTGTLSLFLPSLIGMVLSFISGWIALKWLSNWLEGGRWYLFGFYCIFASLVILLLHARGL
jgi:undecaprenyl-diphosphatase